MIICRKIEHHGHDQTRSKRPRNRQPGPPAERLAGGTLCFGNCLGHVDGRLSPLRRNSLRLDRADYDAVREGPDAASGARLLNRLHAAWVKRSAQIKQVEQEVAASPHPVVVCGDFNDTPMSYVLHTLRSQGLVDAFSEAGSGFGGTYIGDLPPLRIDYVLSSESLEAVRVEVGESVLSDHRWVKAALRPVL